MHRRQFGQVVGVLVAVAATATACGGDADSQSQEDQIESVGERFLIGQATGDVEAYCDSVVLLSGRDLNAYKPRELQREVKEADCGKGSFQPLGERLANSFEVMGMDLTVNGDRAKADVTIEIEGERKETALQFVNVTDQGWRVAFTGY